MKRLSFTFIFLFMALVSFGQKTTAEQFLQTQILDLLVFDKVLVDPRDTLKRKVPGLWNNPGQRKKLLEKNNWLRTKLLRQFRIPSFAANQEIEINGPFHIPNKQLTLLGSYIIRNKNVDSSLQNTIAQLPIITNGDQLSIQTYDRSSNYLLSMNSTKLFEFKGMLKIDGKFLNYFNSKLSTAFANKNSNSKSITIGAGTFKNRLATVFNKLNYTKEKLEAYEWPAIFKIWSLYNAGNVIQNGDEVIEEFDGLVYHIHRTKETQSDFELKNVTKTAVDFEFLKLSANSDTKWNTKNITKVQYNLYNIMMFKHPILTPIPSAKTIYSRWIEQQGSSPKTQKAYIKPGNNTENGFGIISLVYGPIPDDFVHNVRIDTQHFQLQLSAKEKLMFPSIEIASKTPLHDGFYIFDIKITRNDLYLRNLLDIKEKTEKNLSLKLFYNIPNIDNSDVLQLNRVYKNLTIETEHLPQPTPIITDLKYNKEIEGRFCVYSTQFSIKRSNSDDSPITDLKVVGGSSSDLNQSLFIQKDVRINVPMYNPQNKKFTLEIRMDTSILRTIQKSKIRMDTRVSFKHGGKLTERKIADIILLIPPKNQTIKTISNNEELLSAIDFSKTIMDENGVATSLDDIRKSYIDDAKSSAENDTQGFIDFLKKQEEIGLISDPINGGYIIKINSKFLKKNNK